MTEPSSRRLRRRYAPEPTQHLFQRARHPDDVPAVNAGERYLTPMNTRLSVHVFFPRSCEVDLRSEPPRWYRWMEHGIRSIIRTTRSMRRLKPDPVPNELIRKILEAGVCAPSGGNMQRWRFLVIRDAKIKETVGAYYKRAWDEQVAPRYRAGEPATGMSRERFLRLLDGRRMT